MQPSAGRLRTSVFRGDYGVVSVIWETGLYLYTKNKDRNGWGVPGQYVLACKTYCPVLPPAAKQRVRVFKVRSSRSFS